MTGKRFKIDLDEEAITDNGEYCLSLYCFQDKGEKDVCDLLNNLAEENEELNEENRELRMVIDGLKQQNQKFKGRLNDLGVEYYD